MCVCVCLFFCLFIVITQDLNVEEGKHRIESQYPHLSQQRSEGHQKPLLVALLEGGLATSHMSSPTRPSSLQDHQQEELFYQQKTTTPDSLQPQAPTPYSLDDHSIQPDDDDEEEQDASHVSSSSFSQLQEASFDGTIQSQGSTVYAQTSPHSSHSDNESNFKPSPTLYDPENTQEPREEEEEEEEGSYGEESFEESFEEDQEESSVVSSLYNHQEDDNVVDMESTQESEDFIQLHQQYQQEEAQEEAQEEEDHSRSSSVLEDSNFSDSGSFDIGTMPSLDEPFPSSPTRGDLDVSLSHENLSSPHNSPQRLFGDTKANYGWDSTADGSQGHVNVGSTLPRYHGQQEEVHIVEEEEDDEENNDGNDQRKSHQDLSKDLHSSAFSIRDDTLEGSDFHDLDYQEAIEDVREHNSPLDVYDYVETAQIDTQTQGFHSF